MYGGTSEAAVEASVSPKPAASCFLYGRANRHKRSSTQVEVCGACWRAQAGHSSLSGGRGVWQAVGAVPALDLALERLRQQQRLGVVPQREAPQRQAPVGVVQRQRAYAAVVGHAQLHAGGDRPFALRALGAPGDEAAVGDGQQAGGEAQVGGQVNLEGGLHVFVGSERRSQAGPQGAGQDT